MSSRVIENDGVLIDYLCSECDSMVYSDEVFCQVCGEKLDWSYIERGDKNE